MKILKIFTPTGQEVEINEFINSEDHVVDSITINQQGVYVEVHEKQFGYKAYDTELWLAQELKNRQSDLISRELDLLDLEKTIREPKSGDQVGNTADDAYMSLKVEVRQIRRRIDSIRELLAKAQSGAFTV